MTNINFFVGFTLPDSYYIYAVLQEFVIDKQIVFHGWWDYQIQISIGFRDEDLKDKKISTFGEEA